MPSAAEKDWAGLVELVNDLSPAREWIGQLSRLRKWYEPQLERIYDAAACAWAISSSSNGSPGQYASREQFITELTLDPPQVTSDLAGDPARDEDYLILSTIHSAKGQEWDSVYVLNVADGNFPTSTPRAGPT